MQLGVVMVCEIRSGFEPPQLDAPIWHYIRRDHAEDLFATSKLRFKQVASWVDQFEARVNSKSRKLIRARDAELEKLDGIPFRRLDAHFGLQEHLTRITNYGSCWTRTPPSSPIMWQALCLGQSGVAMKSTIRSLLRFVTNDYMFSDLGEIKYRFPGTGSEHFDMKDYMFIKRLRYFYEREVRLTIDMEWEPGSPPKAGGNWKTHLDLPVDLDLITDIVDRRGKKYKL